MISVRIPNLVFGIEFEVRLIIKPFIIKAVTKTLYSLFTAKNIVAHQFLTQKDAGQLILKES